MVQLDREGSGVLAKCWRCKARHGWKTVSSVKASVNAQRGSHEVTEHYWLVRCSGCGNCGLAVVDGRTPRVGGFADDTPAEALTLVSFYPPEFDVATIPSGVPLELQNELREAELCASAQAYRAASAMLRSVLEKTLKLSGYTRQDGSLYQRIEQAAREGVLTDTRRQRAQDEVRDLGNDVLHDNWRKVERPEYDSAHKYVQRVLEDFYDDRPRVREKIEAAGRNVPSEPS